MVVREMTSRDKILLELARDERTAPYLFLFVKFRPKAFLGSSDCISIMVNLMRLWMAIIVLFVASTSIAVCSEMEAGNATFDLGDGYKASFELPDIGNEYVLDYAYEGGISENELLKLKAYGFTISSGDAHLATLTMYVYSSPQYEYMPEAGVENSVMPDAMGPRIMIPKTISGAPGYVGYDLQVGETGTDTSNAMTGFFKCFPGSWQESSDLKGLIEVSGETGDFPATAQSLQVFNSLVDSIKISGPGI